MRGWPRPARAARGSGRCRSGSGPRRSWPRRDPRRTRRGRRRRPTARWPGSRPARASGRPNVGRPRLDRSDDVDADARRGRRARPRAMPNPTATSEPGTTGANSLRPTTMASEMSPTTSVGSWVAPRPPMNPTSSSKKSPSTLSMPNSFGSCPTMIVRARPMMKPLSTGSEMKLARKPRRSQAGDDGDQAPTHRASADGHRQERVGTAGARGRRRRPPTGPRSRPSAR